MIQYYFTFININKIELTFCNIHIFRIQKFCYIQWNVVNPNSARVSELMSWQTFLHLLLLNSLVVLFWWKFSPFVLHGLLLAWRGRRRMNFRKRSVVKGSRKRYRPFRFYVDSDEDPPSTFLLWKISYRAVMQCSECPNSNNLSNEVRLLLKLTKILQLWLSEAHGSQSLVWKFHEAVYITERASRSANPSVFERMAQWFRRYPDE